MRREAVIIGILGLGNLAVWGDRLARLDETHGRIDLTAFEADVHRLLPDGKLVNRPWEDSALIPKAHLHLINETTADNPHSIYLGYYPGLGLLQEQPHNPKTCYQAFGYRLLKGPETVVLEDGAKRHAVQRIVVGHSFSEEEAIEITTYYWHQMGGQLPGSSVALPGPIQQAARRWGGRSDLAWLRVELVGYNVPLDGKLKRLLLDLMESAKEAMTLAAR